MWNNYRVVNGRAEDLVWLSSPEPQRRHQEIWARRVDNVGDWLLQTQESGIGLVVFVVANQMAQHYIPTLGKSEDIRGEEGIANNL